MDCIEFERWLDEGMTGYEAVRGAAERHATSCPACATAAAAARSVEALLAASPASAPSGFADRVMQRVRAGARPGGAAAWIPAAPAMPWWIRALSDPATAVTITLGILFLLIAGSPGTIAAVLSPVFRAASILLPSSLESSGTASASLPVQAGIALGILPIALLASFPLFRWSEALFSGKGPGVGFRAR